jgi:hypothetical protein
MVDTTYLWKTSFCPECKQPYVYTTAGIICGCATYSYSIAKTKEHLYGWICPVCEAVLAPTEKTCDHNRKRRKVEWSQE